MSITSTLYYGNYIPLDILENALKISNSANDKSHINFLIAMTMRYAGGDYSARHRVPDQFEEHSKPADKPIGTTMRSFTMPSG